MSCLLSRLASIPTKPRWCSASTTELSAALCESHDLALYLQSQGVKPDSLVGLCVERSLDMVVGLLGILQAGGSLCAAGSRLSG